MPLTFVPTLVDGDFVRDAHVGPNGDIWVIWHKVSTGNSFRLSIFDPTMTLL